ncbi:MAG TPA: cytochrome P450 [Polyangiales bacterium]|nr:cytochrome P450 [Polyangiales bacterium]
MPKTSPAGPKGMPLFGSLGALRRDPLGLLRDMASYGDVSCARLGARTLYLVNRADLIAQLLPPSQPATPNNHLNECAETIIACARQCAFNFRDDEVRDIHQTMRELSGEIIAKTGLGAASCEGANGAITNAGEIIALALTYGAYLVALHPAVASRLRNELDEQLSSRQPLAADASELPYLDAVVRESLRLYPPLWTVARELDSAIELAGYAIAKGARVWCSPSTIQRDARYFARPNALKPERWFSREASALPSFAYFPVSVAPRPDALDRDRFVMLATRLSLAILSTHVELRPVPGFRMELEASTLLRPRRRVRMLVRRRHRRPRMLRKAEPARRTAATGGVTSSAMRDATGALQRE